MIPIPSGVRVWIATGHTDMRRGMQGLALQIQDLFMPGITGDLNGQRLALTDDGRGHRCDTQHRGGGYQEDFRGRPFLEELRHDQCD